MASTSPGPRTSRSCETGTGAAPPSTGTVTVTPARMPVTGACTAAAMPVRAHGRNVKCPNTTSSGVNGVFGASRNASAT